MPRSIRLPALALLGALTWALPSPAQQGATSRPTSRPVPTSRDHSRPASLSDTAAIAVADECLRAMGGRAAWEATRYLSWRFFGRRLHVWDKRTGDIRVEGRDRRTRKPWTVLMNLRTRKGRAWRDGVEVTDDHEREELLESGRRAWINDGYWVFMPYKLEDPGVTLKLVGGGRTTAGAEADVLELTFSGVGVTPHNKYRVYVGRKSRLVEQWDFYNRNDDTQPRFSTPWTGWKRYGRILLSDGRGPGRRHTQLAVHDSLPRSVFTDPAPIRLPSRPASRPARK